MEIGAELNSAGTWIPLFGVCDLGLLALDLAAAANDKSAMQRAGCGIQPCDHLVSDPVYCDSLEAACARTPAY